MWNITGKPSNFSRFQPFEPAEVLYEFDGPRIFTLIDNDDELNLVYWSDEIEQICRYVVVPTTEKILKALKKGSISVFDAARMSRRTSGSLPASGIRGHSPRFAPWNRYNAPSKVWNHSYSNWKVEFGSSTKIA